MSWGPYWMYYICPSCGKKFRTEAAYIADPAFGVCPDCNVPGTFAGESKELPADPNAYEVVDLF